MKSGLIIQIGTPEELVLHPADDYVEEFTNDLARSKVFSARTVMREKSSDIVSGGSVLQSVKIDDLAGDLIDSELPFDVVDSEGEVLGVITREDVINVLVNKTT